MCLHLNVRTLPATCIEIMTVTVTAVLCILQIFVTYTVSVGTAVAQWLRCCATNRKVAGLIPDGVIGIFH